MSWPKMNVNWISVGPQRARALDIPTKALIDVFASLIALRFFVSEFMATAQTYSNYKLHNTVRSLIATTPQGVISFVSKGWGGRVSDNISLKTVACLAIFNQATKLIGGSLFKTQ